MAELIAMISICEFGIDKFKIFYKDIAVATCEVLDGSVCNIIDQDLQVKKYNVQNINNEMVMFIYC